MLPGAILLLLQALSCNTEEPLQPKFELKDQQVTISPNGGRASAGYLLENKTDGIDLEFIYTEDWVSGFAAETDSTIVFDVDQNPSEDGRKAEVTIKYGEIAHDLTILQEGVIPEEPSFSITEDDVKAGFSGGEYSVSYELSNPVDGEKISATSDQEWVSGLVAEDGTIRFNVAANQNEQRKATVTAEYAGIKDSFTISQEGKEAPFTVTLQEAGIAHSIIDIIPADKSATYMHMHMTKTKYDAFGSDEAVQNDLLSFYDMMASMYNISREDFLAQSILVSGDITGLKTTDLDIDTEYCIFVCALTKEGTFGEEAVKEFFRTDNTDKISFTIDFDIEIKGQRMNAGIIPSDKNQRYYFEFMTPAEIDKYGDNCEQWVQDIMESNISFGEKFGIPLEEVLSTILVSGDRNVSRDFAPQTQYKAAGAAVDDQGTVCSLASSEPFTTGEQIVVSAKVDFVYDSYYDTDQVAETYPEFAENPGTAILPVTVMPQEGLQDWYYVIYSGDCSSPVSYPDSFMVSYIMSDGFKNVSEADVILEYGTTYTYFTVGCDENGIAGPVSRGLINLSRDGVSDAEGFTPAKTNAPALLAPGKADR